MIGNDKVILEIRDKIKKTPLTFYRYFDDVKSRLSDLMLDLDHDSIFIRSDNDGLEIKLVESISRYEEYFLEGAQEVYYQPLLSDFKRHHAIEEREGCAWPIPSIKVIKYNQKCYTGFVHGLSVNFIYHDDKIYAPKETNSKSLVLLNLIGGLPKVLIDSARYVEGRSINIIDRFPWRNFAHWSLDNFPRLLCLKNEMKENDRIIFNGRPDGFHFDMLREIGVRDDQLVFPDEQNNNCLFILSGVVSTNLQYEFRHALHHGSTFIASKIKEFSNSFTKLISGEKLKILLQRKKRGVYISDRVRSLLFEQGFIIVDLDDMPYKYQVGLFKSSTHVISSHGAGLANLIHCNKGTKVLELFNNTLGTHAFYSIANCLELEYSCIKSELECDRDKGINARTNLLENDLLDWLKIN